MRRILTLTLGLLSLGETLLLHWALLAVRGAGLDPLQWLAAGAGIAASNTLLFPLARRHLHARGMRLLLSRFWILGSVAALVTGLALAALFPLIGIGSWLLGEPELGARALVWLGGLVVLAGFGSVVWGSTVGSRRIRVDEIELPMRGVCQVLGRLRIAHITDLHIGPLLRPEHLGRFLDRVNALEPDLVVITGDIFDFDPDYIDEGSRVLGRLRARHGVFAVLGNHDVYTGADAVVAGIRKHSEIRVLRDEWVHLELRDGALGRASLVIAGIEDPGEGWSERESVSPVLARLATEIPETLPCLLLAHRPSYFTHAADLGFPLLLAGHTHGGQVALPLAQHQNISRLISHWTRGRFQRGESTLYVNRGLGMAGLPLRINCPREIALIRLR